MCKHSKVNYMFNLRPYQQECVDETMAFIRKTTKSCVLKLPTAAGKSLIIAELAKQITQLSRKKVLVTAPSKELIEQNAAKYKSFGLSCSIFSASLNKKSIFHDVVFGSPQTIVNEVKKSDKFDSKFSAVIIDEGHGITPSLKKIIETMHEHNPNLRVIALSATPYRTFTGYIYKTHCRMGEMEKTKDPYFDHCVYDLNEWDMIEDGYITKPVFGANNLSYDTSGLVLKASGKFDQTTVDKAFLGKGRLTADIVADVIGKSVNRNAVMFFASSIAHALEIMESLPKDNSQLITGGTDKKERERIIKAYQQGEFKYLVNVAVLTTGFDAPIVDTIAILRRTESPGLFLQIIGRGIRLNENKNECLVLDYAENVGNVVSSHDPFEPIIQVKGGTPGERYEFSCPSCGWINQFALNKDFEGANYNEHGYLLSEITGQPLQDEHGKFTTVHMGQKCQAVDHFGNSSCNHYWDGKECQECGHMNSKSARYCKSCNAELIDPNKKLVITESIANNRNPYDPKTVEVVKTLINAPNSKGNIRLDHYIDGRVSPLFSEFVNPVHERVGYASKSKKVLSIVAPNFDDYVLPALVQHKQPVLITYKKQQGGDFFDAKNHKIKDTN